MVGHKECIGEQSEVARAGSARGGILEERERERVRDGEDREGVVTAIGSVEARPILVHAYGGRSVRRRGGGLGGKSGRGGEKFRYLPSDRVIQTHTHSQRQLIENEHVRRRGVKGEVTRAGPRGEREGFVVFDGGSVVVDDELRDAIFAEIWDKEETVAGGDMYL